MKIKPISIATLLALHTMILFYFTSCHKQLNGDTTYDITGRADGSQETPSNLAAATATLTGRYNANTHTLEYTIDYKGLSGNATVAHLHSPAWPGKAAPPLNDLNIVTKGANGTIKGTLLLHDTMEVHLLSGKLYYNIHTIEHPNGEIRGQISPVRD